MGTRIIAICMASNEADVIEAFVRHNLALLERAGRARPRLGRSHAASPRAALANWVDLVTGEAGGERRDQAA